MTSSQLKALILSPGWKNGKNFARPSLSEESEAQENKQTCTLNASHDRKKAPSYPILNWIWNEHRGELVGNGTSELFQ